MSKGTSPCARLALELLRPTLCYLIVQFCHNEDVRHVAKRKRASAEDGKAQTKALEINKHNRDYQSDEADFTLISSDGLHFRVKKMILMVAR